MYPFHPAPSDFFRFSDKALAVMLKEFKVIYSEAVEDILSTCAFFITLIPNTRLFVLLWIYTVFFDLVGENSLGSFQ